MTPNKDRGPVIFGEPNSGTIAAGSASSTSVTSQEYSSVTVGFLIHSLASTNSCAISATLAQNKPS
jgi:hypothetical protein